MPTRFLVSSLAAVALLGFAPQASAHIVGPTTEHPWETGRTRLVHTACHSTYCNPPSKRELHPYGRKQNLPALRKLVRPPARAALYRAASAWSVYPTRTHNGGALPVHTTKSNEFPGKRYSGNFTAKNVDVLCEQQATWAYGQRRVSLRCIKR